MARNKNQIKRKSKDEEEQVIDETPKEDVMEEDNMQVDENEISESDLSPSETSEDDDKKNNSEIIQDESMETDAEEGESDEAECSQENIVGDDNMKFTILQQMYMELEDLERSVAQAGRLKRELINS